MQIFESFASAIPRPFLEDWSLSPIRRIVQGVRQEIADARVIVFVRGGGLSPAELAAATGANAVGVDWTVDPLSLREAALDLPLQGNLDPLALVAGGEAMRQAVAKVLDGFAGRPHIFNLGHGVVPETPIAHVEEMLRIVRAGGEEPRKVTA